MLTTAEASIAATEIDRIRIEESRLVLPSEDYLDEFCHSIRDALIARIETCPCRGMFTLVHKDGSISKCPWSPARAIFTGAETDDQPVLSTCAGVPLSDCVNLRVLCEFDEVLKGVENRREVR